MTDLSSSPYASKIKKVSLTPTRCAHLSFHVLLPHLPLPLSCAPSEQPQPLRSGIPKLAATPVKTKLPANSRVLARSTSASTHSLSNQLTAPSDDNPPNTPASPVTPTKASVKAAATRKSPVPTRSGATASASSSASKPSYAKPTFAIATRLPAVTRSSIPQPPQRGILKKAPSSSTAGPTSPRGTPLADRAAAITERLTSSQPGPYPAGQSHSRHESGSKSPRSPRSPTTRGHVKAKASTSTTSSSAAPRPQTDSKPASKSVSRQPSMGVAAVTPADEDALAAILESAKQAQAQVAEVQEEEAEIARPVSISGPSVRGHSRGASVVSLSAGHDLLDHDALDDIDVDTDLDGAFDPAPLALPTTDPSETNSAPPAAEADTDAYADDFEATTSSIDSAVYDAPVKVAAEEKEEETAVAVAETAVQEPLVERERSTGSVIFIDASRLQRSGSQTSVVTADGQSIAMEVVVNADSNSTGTAGSSEQSEADGEEETVVDEQLSGPITVTLNITLDSNRQVRLSTELPAQPVQAHVEELPYANAALAPAQLEVAQDSLEPVTETVRSPASTGEVVEVEEEEGRESASSTSASQRTSVGSNDGAVGVGSSFSTIIIDRDPLDRMDPQAPTPVTRTPNVTVSERISVPDTVREDSASSSDSLSDQPGRHSLDADPEPEADPERDLPPTRTPAVSNAVPSAASEQPLLEAEDTVVQSTLVSYDTSALERPSLDVPTTGTRAPAPTTTSPAATTPTKQVAFADKVTSVEAPHPLEDSDVEDLDFGGDDAFPKTPDRPSIDESTYTPPDPIINPTSSSFSASSSSDPLQELKRLEAGRRAEEDKRAIDARLAQEAAARRLALDKAEDEKFEREKEILAKEKVSAQLEESKKALFAAFEAGMKATKLGKKGSPHVTRVYVKQADGRWVVGWDSKKKSVADAQIALSDARCVVGAEEGMFLHRRHAGKYDAVKARCVSVVSPVRGLDLVLGEEAEVNQWVAMMRLLNVKVVD